MQTNRQSLNSEESLRPRISLGIGQLVIITYVQIRNFKLKVYVAIRDTPSIPHPKRRQHMLEMFSVLLELW